MIEKIESQLKAHLFDPNKYVSIIGSSETFKFAFDTNHVHIGAAM